MLIEIYKNNYKAATRIDEYLVRLVVEKIIPTKTLEFIDNEDFEIDNNQKEVDDLGKQ